MELTEEQKKLGLPQAWWDNQEGCKRDIEYTPESILYRQKNFRNK